MNIFAVLNKIKKNFYGVVLFFTYLYFSTIALAEKKELDLNMSLDVGYRMDSIKWSIADPSGQPNVLSELKFNDLEIYQSCINGNIVLGKIFARGSISFGKIVDGKSTDSDYNLDNRNGLFSRSESEVDNKVQDIIAGLGYNFSAFHKKIKFKPLVGLSHHRQDLKITNGVQTESNYGFEAPIGPISNLNSSYDTKWESWWFGADLSFEAKSNLFFSSSFEYHVADYYAEAGWNLRTDFAHPKSFTHKDSGQGVAVKLGVRYVLPSSWDTGIVYNWKKFSTKNGEDRVFLSTGEEMTTKLNEVNWDSQSVSFIMNYEF